MKSNARLDRLLCVITRSILFCFLKRKLSNFTFRDRWLVPELCIWRVKTVFVSGCWREVLCKALRMD